jgi:iron complex transport system permease protein
VAGAPVEGGAGVSGLLASAGRDRDARSTPADAVRRITRRRRRRHRFVTSTLAATLVGVCAAALTLGEFAVTPLEVLTALAGGADAGTSFVVVDLRLPRLLLGVEVGVALALAGAMFQTVLRNPLASPDIIGISQGAGAGAVLALLVLGLQGAEVSLVALAGAVTAGALLYAVSWRGGIAGFRFVLSGIAVAYLATSFVGYLLTRAQVQDAQTALTWLTGSVGSATWPAVRLLALALAVLLPAVALGIRPMRALLLGDDVAAGLGTRPERARVVVIGLGVCLAAVATAVAGPLAFVALTSGPIARRLLGDGSVGLLPTALAGATLVAAADLVAQHALPGVQVPVGVVTGVVGGPYLVWLLARSCPARTP